ncbi:MAG: M20/M25/M40 family metallo-hydrolase [Rhodospirillales bacterium]|nr:M20/M25/M40 family metallo-hydrolase [Rhodospirillales bacterium]
MPQPQDVIALAAAMVAIDSRSSISNLAVAELAEAALPGFAIERLDYTDAAGVAKRALVAAAPGPDGRMTGGLAFSGHLDTVPDTGWTTDPWSARVADGHLHGLGSTDMKGPLAAAMIAARQLAGRAPALLLITTDEETTKAGARIIAERSRLAQEARPRGILVVEPTGMAPVRGHRSHILFTAEALGEQAHSSTGKGRNANWALIPFLAEMKTVFARLREDPALQDAAYDPPFSDFNLVIDNHGAAVNVTVPLATARIKFRRSARVDPAPVVQAVREAAARAGLRLTEATEGRPPELPEDHPLVALCANRVGAAARTAPYGTDASELQAIAPCVVLGPGDIGVAHKPGESVSVAALEAAVPVFIDLALAVAAEN